MAYKIQKIRELLDKARHCGVVDLGNDLYQVTSPTSGEVYQVDVFQASCTCPRQQWITEHNGYVNACSHVQAAFIFSWLQKGYWLVARKAGSANLLHYKRKIVLHAIDPENLGDDGVIFTARQVPSHRIQNHLARMAKPTVLAS